MDAFADRVVFQTREWLTFLERTQRGQAIVAAVEVDGEAAGYFTGVVVRRGGLPILGSPFPGWTTDWMGFNLVDGVSRAVVASALPHFAFGVARCLHVEFRDRRLRDEDVRGLGFSRREVRTFELDLARSDDELLRGMTSACRRAIKKAERVGVVVEEARDEGFADAYYSQLVEVFARQSLAPTYGVDRVRELIRCLHPTGRLLLLRARRPDGACIATAIFPAMNGTAYFWGGASRRSDQILRPNEALFWYAMRYWRDRGLTTLDLGGGGDYKRKYGVREIHVPALAVSRVPGLMILRNTAAQVLTYPWLRRRGLRGAGASAVNEAETDDAGAG
ncbi:MAG TPA: GNAT family N-acetyltransferase [Gaiellaceae bacterium]|jgi:CelD/BcsL family acetyltransferase involved in cellulose biosynthesis